ncbi:Oidioi.mRNA.OKI2018_I69.XSR.g16619.t1.cds [Oikopleura dioica]|uniref:Sodium channel protein n=1 Tax=Oikopleura dioica TaxID=34765 RepID=A0ABN7SGP3_OIKDI|nr:Oidioi.mRNA.OKI2018_I69.XSR.g16619.t1.cds [Oikopleura dioica]
MTDNAASIMKDDRNHRLFDRQMLEEIRQRRADQQIQPSPEEDGMFQDPLLELYRKPDPTLVDGQSLTTMFGKFPPELLGKQIEDVDYYYRNKKTFCVINRRFGKRYINRFSASKSLYLFSPFNPVRRAAIKAIINPGFDVVIILTILINCVFLALDDPVDELEYVFTAIYTLEVVIKVIAKGFILNKFTYLRDAWNWLDFIVVVLAYVTMMTPEIGNVSGLRTFRVLRAFKSLSIVPGLKTIVNALFLSMKPLSEVLFIMVFLLIVISLIGLQAYSGVLQQKCVLTAPANISYDISSPDTPFKQWIADEANWMDGDPDTILCGNSTGAGRCAEGYTCYGHTGSNPANTYGYTNYDHIGWAMLSSFQLLTLDFWENTYNMILRASGAWNVIYFILVILLGPFYLLNLLLAVVTMAYAEEHQKQEELKTMRERAKKNAKKKALKRLKQLKQAEEADGRGAASPDDEDGGSVVIAMKRDESPGGAGGAYGGSSLGESEAVSAQPQSASTPPATSHAHQLSPQDSIEMDESPDEQFIKKLKIANEWFNKTFCDWQCPTGFIRFQQRLESIISKKAFDVMIVLCIVTNTIFLAADHHDADQDLKNILTLGNSIFTYIFVCEAILKITSYGFFTYLKDPWNTFDFIIVVISVSDVILAMRSVDEGSQQSGLNVLRTLRLLRVFRLAQMWKTMGRLLSIIYKSIMDVGYLTLVLFIVLYIFAVIGKQCFADKYNDIDKLSEIDMDQAPKWNFTDFVFSFLMVFRVLCGEWVEPLWDCMKLADPATCIPFFLLITFVANFMVFNLFVAILLEAFNIDELNKDDKKTASAKKQIFDGIKRIGSRVKNTIPTSLRKSKRKDTAETNGVHVQPATNAEYLTENGNDTSAMQLEDMGGNSAVVMSETEYRSRNNRDENSLSITNDRKCSYASVDMLIDGIGNREDEPKTKKQKVDFENDQARKMRLEEELKNIEPPSCGPSWKSCDESCCYTSSLGKSWHKFRAGVYFVAKHPYFEGFILFLIAASTVCLTLEDKNLNDGKNGALKEILDCLELIFAVLFTMEMGMKWVGFGLWEYFTSFWTVLDFIIVCISWVGIGANASGVTSLRSMRTLRALRPLRAISRWEGMRVVVNALIHCIPAIGNVITVCILFWLVFGIMGVQFFAGKFFFCGFTENHDAAHERVEGNFTFSSMDFDGCDSAKCTIDHVQRSEICGLDGKGNMTTISTILANHLGKSIKLNDDGTPQLHQGTLDFCQRDYDVDEEELSFGEVEWVDQCLVWAYATKSKPQDGVDEVAFPKGQLEWSKPGIHFDNSAMAMLALLQVATFEGWMEVMEAATDSREVGQQPSRDANKSAYWYFMIFILVGAFFILNLIVGVIIESFQTLKKKKGSTSACDTIMTPEQKKYVNTMQTLFSTKPKKHAPKPHNHFQKMVYDIVCKPYFEICVFGLICLNMLVLACEHYGMSKEWADGLRLADIVFTIIFLLECAIKIIGLRAYYFRDHFNNFDFIVIMLSSIGIILEQFLDFFISPTLLRVVRVFRIFRVLRVIKAARGIRRLMITLLTSIPALLNIAVLLFLGMVIFAILGMSSFMHVKKRDALNDMVNFETFPNSMLLLFRLMTSAGWNDILDPLMNDHDCIAPNSAAEGDPGNCGSPSKAIIFFISYIIIIFLIIINMYIAVILERFDEIFTQESVGIVDEDYEFFYNVWGKYDPKATQFVDVHLMSDLLHELPKPFKVKKPNEIKIAALQLPVMDGGRIHCLDVLYALTKRLLGDIEVKKEMLEDVQRKLEKVFPNRRKLFPVTTTLEIRQELKAATVIQRAYRAWHDRVSRAKVNALSIPVANVSQTASVPSKALVFESELLEPLNPLREVAERDQFES